MAKLRGRKKVTGYPAAPDSLEFCSGAAWLESRAWFGSRKTPWQNPSGAPFFALCAFAVSFFISSFSLISPLRATPRLIFFQGLKETGRKRQGLKHPFFALCAFAVSFFKTVPLS
jgi:hypothetical protein